MVVPVERNEQLMSYGFYKLRELKLSGSTRVRLTIVQPNAVSMDPIRVWETTAAEILDWGYRVLIPGMVKTETSDERAPGMHCQFCPAKLHCAEALAVYKVYSNQDTETRAVRLTDAELGELGAMRPVAAFVGKAVDKEILRRQMLGTQIPGFKIVSQKANRVWKTGADEVFRSLPGSYNEPTLKSPAQMEEVLGLKDLVQTWAYKPDTGYTTAPEGDRRKAVTLQKTADAFAHYKPGEDL